MKYCNTCKKDKEIEEFHKDINTWDGLKSKCKSCKKEYNFRNKERDSIYHKNHYNNNKETHNKRAKNWRNNNLERWLESIKKWKIENSEYIREWHKEYDKNHLKEKKERSKYLYNNDIEFRIISIQRVIVSQIARGKKCGSTIELLGCSGKKFRKHLEFLFKTGMSWDNYGKVWEIDHHIPISRFDINNEKDQKECFNYMNCRPRFKTTNIAKTFNSDQIGNRNKSNKIII